MDNEYVTPKQFLSIVLVNVFMWIPILFFVPADGKTATDIDTTEPYESSYVLEPMIEYNESVEESLRLPEPPVEDLYSLTDEEIDLLALVTMAEAEGESEEGKRLVIDTILNRVDSDRFPDTVYDVIYQPNAFTSMWTSRVTRCHVRDDIRQLVLEELQSRTNYDVIFFRTDYYHSYGTPLFQEGRHYFSKY